MSHTETFNHNRVVAYRALMTRLAEFVGHHQLPVRPNARDINELLDGDPIHGELAREVVRAIYRSGRCHHLDSKVRAETVFNSLGGIRGRLLADHNTDVDQVNLLEELGWAARGLFSTAGIDPVEPPGREAQPVVLRYPAV